ncbi:MAG: LysR family transcriptional regulator [Rhodobacteraceae bacterium]|nr:LysR family transcriptional regulator [Paracoccaceae bacterium]
MARLPPLTALPAFEAVARLGSMKAAAMELGRTHGAISKQVAHLSEDLGIALLEKTGVGVTLTAEGREYAEVVRSALGSIRGASAQLRRQADSTVIELGVSATFAQRWLTPRMPKLYKDMPGLELHFRMTGAPKLQESDADVVLTFDRLFWEFADDADIHVLGDVSFGLVHAPGMKLHKAEGGYRCDTRFLQQIAGHTWTRWETLSGVTVSAHHDVPHPHTFLAIEAAKTGLGVALVERRLVADDLVEGRLVAPFGFVEVPGGFGAIVNPRSRSRSVVMQFLEWLEGELG